MDTAGKLLEEIGCEPMQKVCTQIWSWTRLTRTRCRPVAVKLVVSVAKKSMCNAKSIAYEGVAYYYQYTVKPAIAFNLPPLDAYLASLTASRAKDLSVDMVEIEGHTGSGKTQLLYHILSACVIPDCHPSSILDAGAKAVVVFDMDGQFDAHRFRDFVVARIRQNFGSASQSTDIVDRCLETLHIFNPISTEQLLVTLARLPKLRRDSQPHSKLTTIAIHSLEACYWSDRFKIESRTRTTAFPRRNIIYQRVYSCLRSIQEICETRVILSHSGLNQVLQHHISQRTSLQEPEIPTDDAPIVGVNDGSILFLTVKRVPKEPGLLSQPWDTYFRISGHASTEQEAVHFDIQITDNEGIVVVQQEE